MSLQKKPPQKNHKVGVSRENKTKGHLIRRVCLAVCVWRGVLSLLITIMLHVPPVSTWVSSGCPVFLQQSKDKHVRLPVDVR